MTPIPAADTRCATCSARLQLADTGRPRRYCSPRCRTAAWRQREAIREANVTKPLHIARQGDNLQLSRTGHPTGDAETGPKLRPRPRQGAL